MVATRSTSTLLDEVTEFLANAPTAQEILAFKPSDQLNQRLHDLLDHAGEGLLTDSEQRELDEFLQMSHLLKMLKGKYDSKHLSCHDVHSG